MSGGCSQRLGRTGRGGVVFDPRGCPVVARGCHGPVLGGLPFHGGLAFPWNGHYIFLVAVDYDGDVVSIGCLPVTGTRCWGQWGCLVAISERGVHVNGIQKSYTLRCRRIDSTDHGGRQGTVQRDFPSRWPGRAGDGRGVIDGLFIGDVSVEDYLHQAAALQETTVVP